VLVCSTPSHDEDLPLPVFYLTPLKISVRTTTITTTTTTTTGAAAEMKITQYKE
jgi:hypothetical protein